MNEGYRVVRLSNGSGKEKQINTKFDKSIIYLGFIKYVTRAQWLSTLIDLGLISLLVGCLLLSPYLGLIQSCLGVILSILMIIAVRYFNAKTSAEVYIEYLKKKGYYVEREEKSSLNRHMVERAKDWEYFKTKEDLRREAEKNLEDIITHKAAYDALDEYMGVNDFDFKSNNFNDYE